MTFRERMAQELEQHGLWPEDVDAILAIATDGEHTPRGLRWSDVTDGYPRQRVAAVWMTVRQIALAWLAEHKPKHWAINSLDPTGEIRA